MEGATMLATLYRLGITPSNSRSRVSNDNGFVESIVKTMKYRSNYPFPAEGGFATIEETRQWGVKVCRLVYALRIDVSSAATFAKQTVSCFATRYEHTHSGLKFLTPAQRRSGKGDEILKRRHKVYEKAKEAQPERWQGRQTRNWELEPVVYLNPAKNKNTA